METIYGIPRDQWSECPQCGVLFHNPKRRFCSPECAKKYQRNPIPEQICPNCNNTFKPRKRGRIYCSQACYEEAVYTPKQVCEWCEKTFRHRNTSKKGNSKRRFCSRECYDTWKRETAENQLRPCAYCGNEFSGQKKYSKYCSKTCAGLAQRKPEREDRAYYRRLKHWKEIRKQILERDNYECQVCFWSGDLFHLHVHHIIPLVEFWPDRIRDSERPENLITLCNSCHPSVEHGTIKCPTPKG